MHKCVKCGSQVKAGAKFCPKCGTPVVSIQPEYIANIEILKKKIENDSLNPNLYIELGSVYQKGNLLQEALVEFEKAININDKILDAYINSGNIYHKLEDPIKAAEYFQKAIAIDRSSAAGKIGLLKALHFQGKSEQVLRLGEDIIQIEPENTEVHRILIQYYINKGLKGKAINSLKRVLLSTPDDKVTLNELASLYSEKSENDKALYYYNKILEIDPDDCDSLFHKGKDYFEKRDYIKAIELLNKSIPGLTSENRSRVHLYLANALINLQKLDEAIANITKLNGIDSNQLSNHYRSLLCEANYKIGCAVANNNNYSVALKYLNNAASYEPSNKDYQEKLEKFKIQFRRSKKRMKIRIMAIALSIVVIVIAIIGGLIWRDYQNEENTYRTAIEIKDPMLYLSEYPNEKYSQRILDFADSLDYIRVLESGAAKDFFEYLQSHKDGKFINEVHYIYDSLETVAYSKIEGSSSIDKLAAFVNLFPGSEHVSIVKKRIRNIEDKLAYKQALQANNIQAFKDYLNKYPNGTGAKDIRLKFEGFVYIDGGTFNAGDKIFPVLISVKSFYINKYEVTQEKWREIMGTNPSKIKDDNLPVTGVNWYDAVEFCNKKSLKDGLIPYYSIKKDIEDENNLNKDDKVKWAVSCNVSSDGYRLSTNAEWEFVARGGNKSMDYNYSGSNKIDEVGWYYKNSNGKPHVVGSKKANELGIYDMSGNVSEWCWDWKGVWDDSEYDSTQKHSFKNPTGASKGRLRILHGGSWISSVRNLSIAEENGINPSLSDLTTGFRLAKSF